MNKDSSHKLQSLVQRPLLEIGPLTEPGGIQAVLVAAGATLMVNVFSHGIE